MVEVKKKEKESLESMLRKFKRRLQKSGKIFRVRKGRYYQKPLSKKMKTRKALRKIANQKQRDLLKKQGKLDDFNNKRK